MTILVDKAQFSKADVGIFLGGREAGVAEKVLNGSEIGARIEQMGGTAMAQGVGGDMGQACLIQKIAHDASDTADVQPGASLIAKNWRASIGGTGGLLGAPKRLESFHGGPRGRHDAVLSALAAADMQGGATRLEIAPIETDTLAGAQAASIKHLEQGQVP